MAVHSLQVTLGAGATQIISSRTPIHDVQFQNNAAHNIRIGDSTVSSSKGILLLTVSGGGGGTLYLGPYDALSCNLFEFWAFGTAADVLDVLYTT
jgi:hypothetical protein